MHPITSLNLTYVLHMFFFCRVMATPPMSPSQLENPPEVTLKRTRQSTRLRSLTSRRIDGPQAVVNINPATSRGSEPHKEIFHSYLGVVAREKIPIVHVNWNVVPNDLKTLIWKDILHKFDIPEGQQIFDPMVKYGLDPETWVEFAKIHKTPNWQFTENPTLNIDPPSPMARHLKWKIARTKSYDQMTSEAAQEIVDKIDILNTAIGRPEHPGRVHVVGSGVTIRQYFGQASRGSITSSQSFIQQQLAEIIGGIKDEIRKEVLDEIRKEVHEEHKQQHEAWMREVEEKHCQTLEIMKQELKQALKIELSHIASYQSTPIEAPEIQRVNVVRIYMPHAEVPFPTSEVRILKQAIGTFVAWPTHLVRKATNGVVMGPNKTPPKSIGDPGRFPSVATDDLLGELVKMSYVIYTKPIELAWDGAKFGLPNSTNGQCSTSSCFGPFLRRNLVMNTKDQISQTSKFQPLPISAISGTGTAELIDLVYCRLQKIEESNNLVEEDYVLAISIVGRPNVAKSTILNALVGEDRTIGSPISGTTRDAIDTEFTGPDGQKFQLIDTAGIKKITTIASAGITTEALSVNRAFRAICRFDVVVLVIEAMACITK
ncbi:GTPase Der [Glycine max]|nr:GTPase Der [Glycine max]